MVEKDPNAVLLLSCPDQKGLVATVADFIYSHKGNIVHADQHTDTEQGMFLQRIEWQMSGFDLSRDDLPRAFDVVAKRFGMDWRLHFSDRRPRMAIMVSDQPHCLYDLLARHRMGEFPADLSLVLSNHDDLKADVEAFGVPFACFPAGRGGWQRADQERSVLQTLEKQQVDVVVLARYMQVLSEEFIARYPNKIINIHHSFLPAFVGARPYHQAYERGVKIIGATAHYATAALDQGPIIEQDVVRISHRDSVADLVGKGKDLEKIVLARAISLHLHNRVMVYGNKTVVFS